MQAHTPMTVVLTDGEVLRGTVEWYDRDCIKLTRFGSPNLLVYKQVIKYVYKDGEEAAKGGSQRAVTASRTCGQYARFRPIRAPELSVGSRRWHFRDQFGHLDADQRAGAGAAGDLKAEIGAIEHAQALVNVADADAVHVDLRHALLGNPHAVIFHLDRPIGRR